MARVASRIVRWQEPARELQWFSNVSTHSVSSRSVMHGTRKKYASFCTPPESVSTNRARLSSSSISKYGTGSIVETAPVGQPISRNRDQEKICLLLHAAGIREYKPCPAFQQQHLKIRDGLDRGNRAGWATHLAQPLLGSRMNGPDYRAYRPRDLVKSAGDVTQSLRIVGVFRPMHRCQGKFARPAGIQRCAPQFGCLTVQDGGIVHHVAGLHGAFA